MNKEFWLRNTVVPVFIGIFFAIICVTFFITHADIFSPAYEGAVLAHHEQTVDTSAVVDKPFEEIAEGDCIGKISVDGGLPIVAAAPYHQIGDVLSFEMDSAQFGKAGYVYLMTDARHLADIQKAISFTAEGCFEKHDYVLVGTREFGSVDEIKAFAPDINRGAIIFAQERGILGLKDRYKALIFEEVQL